jgi:phosphatidylglycerol:prolipoprotein diacylglycerol transferase
MVIIFCLVTIAAFVGARVLHGLINFGYYRLHPDRWLALDFQGFALFGGIISAVVVGIIGCTILKINFWKLGDHWIPFLGLSIALMRVGCFLNGCCFGKETNLPWGVRFPFFSPAHKYQLAHHSADLFSVQLVHPTQLYELLAALIASGIAVIILKKKYREGTAILTFIILFAAIRWINYSFFRVMPDTFDASPLLYPLLYAGTIFVSLVLLVWKKRI